MKNNDELEHSTILVVDDQPENLKVLTTYLKELGCAIRVALHGEKALELAEQFLPDIILLDVMMPGIDGFETCLRLKKNELTSNIPVIFMTALSETSDKVRGFESGGVDYITKPLQYEEVIARVKAHLAVQHYQKQLREKNAIVEEQNEHLHHLNEQLEELNVNKDKFFSIIAHDLRSPFSGLLGLTQMIVEDIGEYSKDEITEIIIQLRDSAEKLYELLENLLTWSRLQRGVIEYYPQPINMDNLIEQNIHLFTPLAAQKRIALQYDFQEEIVVHADIDMINTVVRNLISNSLKFTHEGGAIELSALRDGQDAQISVTDTGLGIQTEHLATLFRIDTRHQRLGTAGEKGTGLGLILCKELIEKNEGTIWAESEEGKGTTFRFTLPLLELTK